MPQQERAHATREAILQSAAEEFDRLGYDRAPLSTILEGSGVTKGAFYFHFASKQALAAALVQLQGETFARLQVRWEERHLSPLCTLIGMFQESATMLADDVVLRAGLRLAADRELGYPGLAAAHLGWEQAIANYLSAARSEGQLRPEVDPAEAARTLCASTLGARLISSATTRCADFPQRMHEILRHVLPSVAAADACVDLFRGI